MRKEREQNRGDSLADSTSVWTHYLQPLLSYRAPCWDQSFPLSILLLKNYHVLWVQAPLAQDHREQGMGPDPVCGGKSPSSAQCR